MAEGSESKLRSQKACVVIFSVIFVAIPFATLPVQKDNDYITTALSMMKADAHANVSMIYEKAQSVQFVMKMDFTNKNSTGPRFVEAFQNLASVTQWTAKVYNSCLEMDTMNPTVLAAIKGGSMILLAIIFCCLPASMVCCCGGFCACSTFLHAISMGIIAFLAFKDSSGMGSLDCAKLAPWMGYTIGQDAAAAAYSAYPSSFITASSLPTTVANISAFPSVMSTIYKTYGNGSAPPLVDECQSLYLITASVDPYQQQAITAAWARGVLGRGVDLSIGGTTANFYNAVFQNVTIAEEFCNTMTSDLSTLFQSVAITMIVLTVVAVCLACFCARAACIARELNKPPSKKTQIFPEEKGGKEAESLIKKEENAAPKKGFGLCSRQKCCTRQ